MAQKLKILDLFAGAGGLSLGFERTQHFVTVAAVEINKEAQETFKKNREQVVLRDDILKINYEELMRECGRFDVIIGGPPCQGFSNANRQKNHIVSLNNKLVKEFVRAILAVQPKAFLMENVGMLTNEKHRFYLEVGDEDFLHKYDINYEQEDLIQLLPEQFANESWLGFVTKIEKEKSTQYLWKRTDYTLIKRLSKLTNDNSKLQIYREKNRKKFEVFIRLHSVGNLNDQHDQVNIKLAEALKVFLTEGIVKDDLVLALNYAIAIQDMYGKLKEILDNHICIHDWRWIQGKGIYAFTHSFSVLEYITQILKSDKHGYVINHDVLNSVNFGVPQKRKRFILLGIKKEINSNIQVSSCSSVIKKPVTVRDAIEDLEVIEPFINIGDDCGLVNHYQDPLKKKIQQVLCNSDLIYNHVSTKTRPIAMQRFEHLKQGQNFHDLDDSLKTTYSDVKRTQNTIYLRLNYDEPSPTVLNVRKSMWVHPILNRAISIREAARLQSFPDDYRFYGSKNSQYQQIGNAVPPLMAEGIGEYVYKCLKQDGQSNNCAEKKEHDTYSQYEYETRGDSGQISIFPRLAIQEECEIASGQS